MSLANTQTALGRPSTWTTDQLVDSFLANYRNRYSRETERDIALRSDDNNLFFKDQGYDKSYSRNCLRLRKRMHGMHFAL